MRVIYTEAARAELFEALDYIDQHHPTVRLAFLARLDRTIRRISLWPRSAQEVADRPGVRVVPLIHYPYKIFYNIENNTVQVLHVHHAARDMTP